MRYKLLGNIANNYLNQKRAQPSIVYRNPGYPPPSLAHADGGCFRRRVSRELSTRAATARRFIFIEPTFTFDGMDKIAVFDRRGESF